MRTTLVLDDESLREVRTRAARQGSTLSAAVADLLRAGLARAPEPSRALIVLPVYRGDGPRAGVDLDPTSALLLAADEEAFRAPH